MNCLDKDALDKKTKVLAIFQQHTTKNTNSSLARAAVNSYFSISCFMKPCNCIQKVKISLAE